MIPGGFGKRGTEGKIEAIRYAREKKIPFLGICLGHQLLAECMGGKVSKSQKPEVGVLDVLLTESGQNGVFF